MVSSRAAIEAVRPVAGTVGDDGLRRSAATGEATGPTTAGGRGHRRPSKAVLDGIAAALILAGIAPLLLLIAAAVRLTSRGPILYRQDRYGRDERVFAILKFRTMYAVPGGDAALPVQATVGDPRITPIGRLLRRTSLDELPQLLNVLRGEMSLVGPRPHAVAHNEYYAARIEGYRARHRVKPGITGWAQVHGFRGETARLEQMADRVRYDLDYIERWSLALDLRILLTTAGVAFWRRDGN